MSEAIKREWRSIGLGGVSTVVSATKPLRNDRRIPPYAYDEANGHCIAYPFVEDDGKPRMDFVCFSHDDARLVAEAGNAWSATGLTPRQLADLNAELVEALRNFVDGCSLSIDAAAVARAVLAKVNTIKQGDAA